MSVRQDKAFNRTILELKLESWCDMHNIELAFNRTILELKPNNRLCTQVMGKHF